MKLSLKADSRADWPSAAPTRSVVADDADAFDDFTAKRNSETYWSLAMKK